MIYVVFLDTSTTPSTAIETISERQISEIGEKTHDRRSMHERDTLRSWNAKVNQGRGDDRYAEVVEAGTEADAIALAIAREMADRPKDEEC